MTQEEDKRFTGLVGIRLSSEDDVQSLWRPVAEVFDRSGPEAAKEHLEAERQRLEERVQTLLSEFESE